MPRFGGAFLSGRWNQSARRRIVLMRKNARAFRECHSTFEASPFRQPEGRGFFLQPKHLHSASLVFARMLARSGRTLLDSGKHLARPTTCLQIDERREKMNEVGAEPLSSWPNPTSIPAKDLH